jgi:thioredoxin 1
MNTTIRPHAAQPMFASAVAKNIKEVTTASFEAEVLNSDKPVLVKFGAPWCGPCRSLDGVLNQVNNQLKNQARLKMVSVNIDASPELAVRYGVASIPHTFLFKKKNAGDTQNSPVANQVGLVSLKVLNKLLDDNLGAV